MEVCYWVSGVWMLWYSHRSGFPDEWMLHSEAARTIGECASGGARWYERRNVGAVNVIIRLAREEWRRPRHIVCVPRCRQAALRHQASARTHKTDKCYRNACQYVHLFTYVQIHIHALFTYERHITMKNKGANLSYHRCYL